MLEDGPPHILFQERLRDSLATLGEITDASIIETLRSQYQIASSHLNLPRHARFLDQVRVRLGKRHGRSFRDKDLASTLLISTAAVSNFRKARETSSRVRGFFEAMFNWCHEPEIHPRIVWLYTKLLVVESFDKTARANLALFLQCHHLARNYDAWRRLTFQRGGGATDQLTQQATARAATDLEYLARYEGHYDSRHLQDTRLQKEWHREFLRIGPWCLAIDARIHQIISKGGPDAA